MNDIIKKEDCGFSPEQVQTLKKLINPNGAINDNQMMVFLHLCKRTKLDPFAKQIYAIPRGGQLTIQTSIDGFRLIAERTGRYAPGKSTIFTFDEGGKLISATAFIKKMTEDGSWHEVAEIAYLNEYNGKNTFWNKMPTVMLAKCAEARALRRAFPAELSGLYSEDEMDQAEKGKNEDQKNICDKLSVEQVFYLKNLIGDRQDFLEKALDFGGKVQEIEQIIPSMYTKIVNGIKKKINEEKQTTNSVETGSKLVEKEKNNEQN